MGETLFGPDRTVRRGHPAAAPPAYLLREAAALRAEATRVRAELEAVRRRREEFGAGEAGPGWLPAQVARCGVHPMLRVLVVDDDPETAETAGALLELWGHDPFLAPTAAASRAADRFHPDVVLLHLGPPGTAGPEVARKFRQRPGEQPVIICISGPGQDEERRLASEAGCNHHFLRPADPEELRQLLEQVQRGLPPALPGMP
jgi:CheY-like chemotaxis protein